MFRYDDIDRIPYMAPGLVGRGEGRARQDADRRVVAHDREPDGQGEDGLPDAEAARASWSASSRCTRDPGDLVLDFFAGSGTTGEAAARHGRGYLLVDSNPEAVRVMARRLAWDEPELVGCEGVLET